MLELLAVFAIPIRLRFITLMSAHLHAPSRHAVLVSVGEMGMVRQLW
jgi:hypothetical protein